MTTRNATIYHCASCGRVEHTEQDAETPQCCGRAMAAACEESIREGDASEEAEKHHSRAQPPKTKGETKPR